MRVADPIRPQPATAAVLLLFLLLAWPAAAQFQLQVVEPAGPRSAPPVYDLGSGYANETLSATFRLGNVSTAPATASVITVGGTGFSLTAPSLPVTIDPGVSLEFQVNFRASGTGSYSAVLRAENITILLTAAVLPRLTYLVEGATAGMIIDFGSALPGTAMRRHFTVLNETSLILTVPAISLIGKDFFFACNPPSGIALAPLQSAAFDIDFIPSGAGARQAILVLGDRSSVVTGTGLDPPLPQPQISIDLPRTASAQQGILIVNFDRPAASAGTGTAVLDFRGSADPTVAFAGGGRTAAFRDCARRYPRHPAVSDRYHRRHADFQRGPGQRVGLARRADTRSPAGAHTGGSCAHRDRHGGGRERMGQYPLGVAIGVHVLRRCW